jgi:hypothetical protein
MPLPDIPTTVIVPVVTVTTGTLIVHELWGTAFLVRPGIFMSAKHVFGISVPQDHTLSVVYLRGSGVEPVAIPITSVYSDPNYDIAIARAERWPRNDALDLAADDQLAMNHNVLTVEYSNPDRSVLLEDGRMAMNIGPNWHKGYMVREYVAQFGHQNPTACLDLSFPAFKGASGAPVVEEHSGRVLGMIVANVERHLLPAYMERIERSDRTIDEVRYFAPYAQAIMARHLRPTLEAGIESLAGR